MEGKGWEKFGPIKKGQRSAGRKFDCGKMLVKCRVKRRMKNIAHPVNRTANWCSHGGMFTLARLHYTNWSRFLNITN
jgi:hypothetical protein